MVAISPFECLSMACRSSISIFFRQSSTIVRSSSDRCIKSAAEKTGAAVKETAKKAVKTAEKAVKTAAKATKAKKETVKKAVEAEIKDEVFVQFAGGEINVEAVVAAAKADYKAKGHRTPKTVSVYIKPEEGVAYYTVKGVGSEDYKVEL